MWSKSHLSKFEVSNFPNSNISSQFHNERRCQPICIQENEMGMNGEHVCTRQLFRCSISLSTISNILMRFFIIFN